MMLSVEVLAEGEGAIFNGRYSDPNHPDGFRVISIDGEIDPENGLREGTCKGSDTSSTEVDYTLPAKAGYMRIYDTIFVDFSPKGGPADFMGYFETEGGAGIRWSDGNKWPKVDDLFLQ